MYQRIQKILDWIVKIASLGITGPATWLVAGELYSKASGSSSPITSGLVLAIIQLCALLVVEGVMLSNWLLLEYDKQASPEIKSRYALTALGMYAAMALIGWAHEGPTGLVFRFALLAALLGSGWDTFVYTWQKATAKADKSIENHQKVRRYARKLAINQAKARLNAEDVVAMKRIEHQQTVGLAAAERDVRHELDEVQAQSQAPSSAKQARTLVVNLDRLDRELLNIYTADPTLSLSQAGKHIKRSGEAVRQRLVRLQQAGLVHRNGTVQVLHQEIE